MTTIDQLLQQWNELRNAALGRGTARPKGVSAALATRVAHDYEAWRAWLAELGPLDTLYAQASFTDNMQQWSDRYAALRLDVQRATGAKLSEPVLPVLQQELSELAEVALPIGVGVVVAAALLALLLLGKR